MALPFLLSLQSLSSLSRMSSPYTGRFAPSPTGPLHIGSLIAAVASYLEAKKHKGRWLVRMEDLDPPREPAGAAEAILNSLQAHGLYWDDEVLWQSQQQTAYQQALDKLFEQQQAYYCVCSRAEIQSGGGIYQGACRGQFQRPTQAAAVRVQTDSNAVYFKDSIQGAISQQLDTEVGDFVVLRKDGLFAYQLAVVVDDAQLGITHIVRGSDLLDSSPRQIYLQQLLGYPTPHYCHIPVISNAQGQKLSKQTHAPALDDSQAVNNLRQALQFLQQPTAPGSMKTPQQLLQWALAHWQLEVIPRQMHIEEDVLKQD